MVRFRPAQYQTLGWTTMPHAMTIETGCWWRFSRYEITSKGVIKPAKDAKLERYEPWVEYYSLKGKRDQGKPPYESLLQLCAALYPTGVWFSPYPIAKEREQLVLDWCCRNGLLGILLEYTYRLNLNPAHRPKRGGEDHEIGLSYVRRGGYFGYGDESGPLTSRKDTEPSVILENFSDKAALSGGFGPFDIVVEPLSKTWHRFFPNVRATKINSYRYPEPHSDNFWLNYGEPLEFFAEFVRFFYEAARSLSWRQEGAPEFENDSRRVIAASRLSSLTSRVSTHLDCHEDGSLSQRWSAFSLLTSYAMMLHLDMLGGRRLIQCRKCNRPFMSNAYQAEYCSTRCRNTVQKRRYRENLEKKSRGQQSKSS
jgi:hypothetical protein